MISAKRKVDAGERRRTRKGKRNGSNRAVRLHAALRAERQRGGGHRNWRKGPSAQGCSGEECPVTVGNFIEAGHQGVLRARQVPRLQGGQRGAGRLPGNAQHGAGAGAGCHAGAHPRRAPRHGGCALHHRGRVAGQPEERAQAGEPVLRPQVGAQFRQLPVATSPSASSPSTTSSTRCLARPSTAWMW